MVKMRSISQWDEFKILIKTLTVTAALIAVGSGIGVLIKLAVG
jgi:hypothetical protein